MAAGQFSASRSRRPAPARGWFTLDQANRSLPLVRRIVRDIVNAHGSATQLQAKLEGASARDASILRDQLADTVQKLEQYVIELEALGIELKDYDTGLVDFPGRSEGRDVYLCWKLGEEKVAWWHDLHTGFAGRQPASTLKED